MFVPLILLSIAISLDGFSAGLAYGMRSLKIPFSSLVILALSSAAAMIISMYTGRIITIFLPAEFVPMLGGFVLLILGGWVLITALLDNKSVQATARNKKAAKKSLWQNPAAADLDNSGSIGCFEAFLLGGILATDAFAAGLGASFMGFNPLLAGICVGLSKLILVSLGLQLGYRSVAFVDSKRASLFASGILITMGFFSITT